MEQREILVDLFTRADQALQDGDWDKAKGLFKEALAQKPDDEKAKDGVIEAEKRRKIDDEVVDLIGKGDEQQRAGRYRAAYNLYTDALNLGGHNRVLKHHEDIEARRGKVRDLLAWEQRIEEVLAQVKVDRSNEDWDAALERIRDLLQEIPQETPDAEDKPYARIAEPVQAMRQDIEKEMGDQALYDQAFEFLQAQYYEECIRLAENVSSESTVHGKAQRLLKRARDHYERYIKPQQQQAQEFYNRREWANAYGVLEELRKEYENSPAWKNLWLDVAMALGEQELDEGRRADKNGQFLVAQRHFEEARDAFARVIEVYDRHPLAPYRRDEAAELAGIAAKQAQAEANLNENQREKARAALRAAKQHIDRAKSEGREYATVAAVVEQALELVEDEIAQIDQATTYLRDAERHLDAGRLGQADELFHKVLNALLPQQRRQASEGLEKVDKLIHQFNLEMEQGRSVLASDPAGAAARYERAYEIRRDDPDVLKRLIEAHLEAGRGAKSAGEQEEAVPHFKRVRELDSGNRTALRELEHIDIEPVIRSAIRAARKALDGYKDRSDVTAAEIGDLEVELTELVERAGTHDDLVEAINQVLREVIQRRAAWKQYEEQHKEAEEAKSKGHWPEAVERLREALTMLGADAPASLQRELGQWQAIVEAIETAQETAVGAIEDATGAYSRAPDDGDFGPPLAILESAETGLARVAARVQQAEGVLPSRIIELRQRVGDLHSRVETVRDAFHAPTATEGLLTMRQLRQKQGDDDALVALEEILHERAQAEVDQHLLNADTAMKANEWDKAVEWMQKANQLRPDDPAIAAKYATYVRLRQLREDLRNAEREATTQRQANSAVNARDALHRALERLLSAEEEVPAEIRTLVSALLDLEDQQQGQAFGKADSWETVQEKLSSLGQLATEGGWIEREASRLASEWTKLARDIALMSIVASETELGNLHEAYRAAETYFQRHNQNEEAIKQLAKCRQNLLNRIKESTSKRVSWAVQSRDSGNFQSALKHLTDLQTDFYDPVAADFPRLLERDDIVNLHTEVQDLQDELQRLLKKQEMIQPNVEAAEKAVAHNRLDEAEKELAAITDWECVPLLEARAKKVRGLVAQGRRDEILGKLRSAITTANNVMRLFTSGQELDETKASLEKLSREIDIQQLPVEDRNAYYDILERVEGVRQAFGAYDEYMRQYELAIAQPDPDYISALRALTSAHSVARDGSKKAKLEGKLHETERLAEQQKQAAAAVQNGRNLFRKGEYLDAKTNLEYARDLGAKADGLDELIKASYAGMRCASTEEKLEQERMETEPSERADLLRDALDELDDVQILIDGNEQAKEIGGWSKLLRKKIERRLEERKRENSELEEVERAILLANMALAEGEPQRALEQIQPALIKNPMHVEARKLQRRILGIIEATTRLGEAKAAMTDGDYDTALAKVDIVLDHLHPESSEAAALKSQIESGREANEALVQAESLAQAQQFQQARGAIHKAIECKAPRERVRKVQDLVADLEKAWERETIEPIRSKRLDGEYENALSLCNDALARVGSSEFRVRLENLQTEIVNQWITASLDMFRLQLRDNADEAEYTQISVSLERLAAIEPPPATHIGNELQGLLDDVHARRLRCQLGRVREKVKAGAWEPAIEMLNAVAEEADRLSLGLISHEVIVLETEIEDKRIEADRERLHAEYEWYVNQAQPAYEHAKERLDYERALTLAQQALQVRGFENDPQARSIVEKATQAIELYDETRHAIDESRTLLRDRLYDEAAKVLDLAKPAPLLADTYKRQRELAQTLRQADRDQENAAWGTALDRFLQAVSMDEGLANLLEDELDRCRRRLLEPALARAQRELDNMQPDAGAARRILEEVEQKGWVTPAYRADVDKLNEWIASQQHVAEAIAILRRKEGDPQEALAALSEARRKLPEKRDDKKIDLWENLAMALVSWPADLDRVQECLDQLSGTPLKDLRRVQHLRQDLEQKLLEREQARQEVGRLDNLFAAARQKVDDALNAVPVRYEDAVEAARHAAIHGRGDSRSDQICISVASAIEQAERGAAESDRFDEALRLTRLLAELAPDQYDARLKIAELESQQQQRFRQLLDEFDRRIDTFDLGAAQDVLEKAGSMAGKSRAHEITAKTQALASERALKAEVDDLLDAVDTAANAREWDAAVTELEKARQRASGYPAVIRAVTALQERLQILGQAQLDAEQFATALDLCSLGLQLGPNAGLSALQEEIGVKRNARLAALRAETDQALAIWDVEAARSAVEDALSIAPSNRLFVALEDQIEEMEGSVDDVRESMTRGWAALWTQDYGAAGNAFQHLLDSLPHFQEARLWKEYTTSLDRAVRIVTSDNWELFPEIPDLLREAGACFQSTDKDDLPVILPEAAQQRKQAVWNTWQLQELARELVKLYSEYDGLYRVSRVEDAWALAPQVDQHVRLFLHRHNAPTAAPEDFALSRESSKLSLEEDRSDRVLDESSVLEYTFQSRPASDQTAPAEAESALGTAPPKQPVPSRPSRESAMPLEPSILVDQGTSTHCADPNSPEKLSESVGDVATEQPEVSEPAPPGSGAESLDSATNDSVPISERPWHQDTDASATDEWQSDKRALATNDGEGVPTTRPIAPSVPKTVQKPENWGNDVPGDQVFSDPAEEKGESGTADPPKDSVEEEEEPITITWDFGGTLASYEDEG